jgi:XRE family aerobic/anaerobic benzoate catabolism transcriptional regulator
MNPAVASRPVCSAPEDTAAADLTFLSDVGRRVRHWRARVGITRKQLARTADVSERYLGQLETGEGNISILLLRRIALALDAPLAQLLSPAPSDPDHEKIASLLSRVPAQRRSELIDRLIDEFGEPDRSRTQRVALIGLRGAGKSTLGTLLAKALRVPLVELNREVARDTGLPIADVMALYGVGAYRRIECRALERVAREQERAVIVAGGGIVADEEAFALLLANCYTVWIKAQPEEHMARVLAQGDFRPMAGNETAMDDLRRILAARETLYAKADAVIDTSGESPQQSFTKLRQAVGA